MSIKEKTYNLINDLKSVCHSYGLTGDGNEYKIITQVFLYKFLNDKFGYEIKKISPKLSNSDKWDDAYSQLSEKERIDLLDKLSPDILKFEPNHLITYLWNNQTKGDFDILFDSTMIDIAEKNQDIFSTHTSENTQVLLFEKLTNYITDETQKAPFARALIDKLAKDSFEDFFEQKYDFFADIFEYLIKDYNTAGGGEYAEYYTPHSIAMIMSKLLVGNSKDLHNVECYDPSAGTGTLLMALAHQIGEDKCTIFSQDIAQKSSKMLKLNLIINGLVSSLDNAIQGNTMTNPYHKSDDGTTLRQFDYVVSNPPFKMDFSEDKKTMDSQPTRFWAGVPNIQKKNPKKTSIYPCFIQHVINSIKDTGKGAIVVPTGFLTSKTGVERKVLSYIIDEHIVYGAISMPSNVFANTGTNVSVLFLDKSRPNKKVILIDASELGETYKDEDNIQRHRLRSFEIDLIVNTFLNKDEIDDFSVTVTYDEIIKKNYSLSAGQYFDLKIEYVDISDDEFKKNIKTQLNNLKTIYTESHKLETEITKQIGGLIK